jgi:hypothetical protein
MPRELKETQKDAIDEFASLKINAIFYPASPDFFQDLSEWVDGWLKVRDYCRERFIELVPSVDSLRSNHGEFSLEEGWWVRDEEFVFKDEIAVADKPFANILCNGDFEFGDSGIPDGWSIKNTEESRWVMDETVSKSGRYSMRLEAYGGKPAILSTEIEAEPESIYLMTLWMRSEGIRNAQPRIIFGSLNGFFLCPDPIW